MSALRGGIKKAAAPFAMKPQACQHEKLNRPHGRVRFAGEHLSEEWQGFMEGGVETGETAADHLIKFGF